MKSRRTLAPAVTSTSFCTWVSNPLISTLTRYRAARQRLEVEEAGRVRWSRADELLPCQLRGDRGARHRAAALVLHVAADGAADLRLEGGGLQQNQQCEKNTEQRQATSHRPNPLFREERHLNCRACHECLEFSPSKRSGRAVTGDKIYPAKYSNRSSIFFLRRSALGARTTDLQHGPSSHVALRPCT